MKKSLIDLALTEQLKLLVKLAHPQRLWYVFEYLFKINQLGVGQKFFKNPGQKTREMNQFHGIFFFGYNFPFSESKILIFMENIQKNFFREIDLPNFTSFLACCYV